VIAHARAARPRECCGILLGSGDEIVEGVQARNLDDDPARFLIDPKDHIEARRSARARGVQVVGFYHSHPHSSAEPSTSDAAEASYADHLYLIVSLLPPSPRARLFAFDGCRFAEVRLRVVESMRQP
jgi:proteasome lid subunit RPN8/RPN11